MIDIVWLVCVLYIFVSECLEMLRIVRRSGKFGLLNEYLGFWNLFDWISLFTALVVIVM